MFVLLLISASLHAEDEDEDIVIVDYCYNPGKPLLFSTSNYKKLYDEDMKEYEKCRKLFIEMVKHVNKMQKKHEEINIKMNKEYIKVKAQ